MPSGINVVALPSAVNTWVSLYGPVPAGKTLVFNVRAAPVTATAATVKIATSSTLPTTTPPTVAEHLEFDSAIGAKGTAPLLNTGEIALAGQYVGVQSSVASAVAFRLSGFLKDDA